MPTDTVRASRTPSVSSSLSAFEFAAQLGSADAPLIVDCRGEEAFSRDQCMLPAAIRVPIAAVATHVRDNRPVVTYCSEGHASSQNAASALRAQGVAARHLEGGIVAWQAAGLVTVRKRPDFGVPSADGSRWVTRERPKIDRIACPWLLRRFIDPFAHFLYVPTPEVFAVAQREHAVAYDIPGAPIEHDGPRCSFDTLLAAFDLHDVCLDDLAVIVRGADTAHLELAPQCAGLLAVSLGLSANFADDHAMLERGMIVYDALYGWLKRVHAETHTWSAAP